MNKKKFKFENTVRITEEEYFEFFYVIPKKAQPGFRILVGCVAIACFFNPYTFVVGLALVGYLILDLFSEKIKKSSYGNTFHEFKILKGKATYGVSEQGLWAHGVGFDAKIIWAMIRHWEVKADGCTSLVRACPHSISMWKK
jgi:hypothetical protein|tara:strand:+ start:826 stop:1251 length:426 start_codon:yes stop_codon:yes gene_type:complete